MNATKQLPKGLDVASVSAALKRAATRAHFIAYQNGDPVIMEKDGKSIIVPPSPAMYGELLAEVERKRTEVVANYPSARLVANG